MGANSRDLLRETWQAAQGKFWSLRHLLLADAHMSGRLRILDRIVGVSILWSSRAFPPKTNALSALNQLMFQMVVWMLKAKKHGGETWAEFRQKVVRQARQMVLRFLLDRWSLQWARRWWSYSGHVARGSEQEPKPAPTIMSEFRTVERWEVEQRRAEGQKHTGRFYAKMGPLDKSMTSICGGHATMA